MGSNYSLVTLNLSGLPLLITECIQQYMQVYAHLFVEFPVLFLSGGKVFLLLNKAVTIE